MFSMFKIFYYIQTSLVELTHEKETVKKGTNN